MKRPFAVIGITYLLSQAVAAYLGSAFALICAIVFALMVAAYCFLAEKRNITLTAIAITVSVAMLASFAYTKIYVETVVPVEGKTVSVKGKIVEEPYEEYGRYYYVIKTESIEAEGVRQKTKIRISSSTSLEAEYSDVFEGEIQFTSIKDENSYASHKRLLSKGITATAYIPYGSYINISSGKGGIYGFAISLRNILKKTVNDLYPDETGDVLIAMMTGDESGVDSEIVAAFRNTGMAHVLAVSGLHLTLLASATTWILRRLFINRKIVALIVCAASWLFVAVAGFPMSSLRSAIMITVMLLGVLVDRLHTPLNSLGLAVLIICIGNPYAAIDAGLMMSFSSTFGLIEAAPAINRYAQRAIFKDKTGVYIGALRGILSSFVTSLTASIFILPASVLYFGKVSLLSPIANLLLVSVAVLFLGIGMLTVFIGMLGNIGGFIAYPLMTVDWVIGKLLVGAVEILDNVPGAVLNTGGNTGIVVFSCILIGILWVLLFSRSKHRKRAFFAGAVCCVIIVFVWFWSGRILSDAEYVKIYNADDSVMVMACDGKSALLLGAGGDDYDITLMQYDMQDKGLSGINALVLNDISESGASGAHTVIENLNPVKVYTPYSGYCSDTVAYAANKKNIEIGSSVNKTISSNDVRITNLEDGAGLVWSLVECGKMRAIVCPANSDCLNCPFDGEFDAAVLPKELPSCVYALYAKAYIVCADYTDGAIIISQLMARGLKNVYCTGINGNIELAMREGRVYIGGDDI